MTVLAGIRDHRPNALTGRTGLLDREEALLHAYLARAAAGCALLWLRACLGATAIAGFASDLGRDIDRDGIATHGFLEVETQLVPEIGAAEYLWTTPSATAEDIAEHVPEDVAESLGAESTGATHTGTAHAIVPEAVIGAALVLVAEDLVGLLGLLELRFCALVVLVAIGMVLHGESPIRLLDLVSRCRLRDP